MIAKARIILWRYAVASLAMILAAAAIAGAGSSLAPRTPTSAVASPNDPLQLVKNGLQEAIAIFQDKTLSVDARRAKLREAAVRYFDFAYMARSALGPHWRDLTPAQRNEFVPLFTTFIEEVYLSKVKDYSVEKVQDEVKSTKIQFVRESYNGPDYAEVYSTVALKEHPDPVQVDYLLKKDEDGWRVYDITLDAISVMANYRNQFNRVINNDGYDKLIADLRAKSAQLGARTANQSQ
jgi:phospholipid transport system substrate-binding protein